MIGREHLQPISLRVSITEQCQLRCLYCMSSSGVQRLPPLEILSFEEIIRFVRVLKKQFAVSKIHLTGGEPLIRPRIAKLVAMLVRDEITDIALTTNGQLLRPIARSLKEAGLRRVNISLDSLKSETFHYLTRGGELHRTLAGIEAALHCGLAPVKLNVAVLKKVNTDELVNIARFGLERGCEVRFLELMPIGPAAERFGDFFVPSGEVLAMLGEVFDLDPAPARSSSSSRDYVAKDKQGRKGIIGLISSQTAPFCYGCRRLRLTAAGQLIGCLARGEGPNIRPFLRDGDSCDTEALIEAIHDTLRLKRNAGAFSTTELMARVGG